MYRYLSIESILSELSNESKIAICLATMVADICIFWLFPSSGKLIISSSSIAFIWSARNSAVINTDFEGLIFPNNCDNLRLSPTYFIRKDPVFEPEFDILIDFETTFEFADKTPNSRFPATFSFDFFDADFIVSRSIVSSILLGIIGIWWVATS